MNEPDFIGGQGSLTKAEEIALSQYFAKKKNKGIKSANTPQVRTKARQIENA